MTVPGLMVALALAACGREDRQPAPAPPCADHARAATSPAATPPPGPALAPPTNPAQAEMRLLSDAMVIAVQGVGSRDVRAISPALHRVDAAKAATEAALESGAWRPAVHGDQRETFASMDQAFHEHLEHLLAASETGDVAATATALAAALQACEGCHTQFRAPPAAIAAPTP